MQQPVRESTACLLGMPQALVIPSASSRAARGRLRAGAANMTAPISSSSIPAASSTVPNRNRWRHRRAMAQNGKVIVNRLHGAEPEQIERPIRRALDIRAQQYESVLAAVHGGAAAAQSASRPVPPQGIKLTPRTMRI